MRLGGLALRNISGSSFRSQVIALCVLVVAGLCFSTTLIIQGAQDSLDLAAQRLGADLVVVPKGSETRVETALFMGKPTTAWMPESNYERIAALPGVAVASPQLFLGSLNNASCCAVSEMFMIVIDPKTDFTIRPWLERNLGRDLTLGEAVGGRYVSVPEGEDFLRLYGYDLTLVGTLEPTGMGLDQTLFLNLDTAREMARVSLTKAEKPLELPADSVSAVMVKTAPGVAPHDVALRIIQDVPGVTVLESPTMFQSARKQMNGLLRSLEALLGLVWALSLALLSLVFSVAANERRREIGVLRALGSTRNFVFLSLLTEAALLALVGGVLGISLSGAAVYLFRGLLMASFGIPLIFPPVPELAAFVAAGFLLALGTAALAALFPALRVSRQDPATAMRE